MKTCPQTERVMEAIALDDGSAELLRHLATCELCTYAVLDRGLGRVGDGVVDDVELALYAAGMGGDEVAQRAERVVAADPGLAHDLAVVRDAARKRETAFQRGEDGRPRRPWASRLVLATAGAAWAAGLLMFLMRTPPLPDGPRPRGDDDFQVAVNIGDRDCPPAVNVPPATSETGAPAIDACSWATRTATLALSYRRELTAEESYLVVVIRDSDGDVSPLYRSVAPLPVTTERRDGSCQAGLCWLEGGRYRLVPGRAEIFAIATTTPIDDDAVRAVIGGAGSSSTTHVFRYRLEITE